MDVASVAMSMSAIEASYQASVATMKGAMDSMEAIATELIDQLLTLNVGSVAPAALDMYV